MLQAEKWVVMNFENAIRGARNAMNSWDRSDSYYDPAGRFVLGANDLKLARQLARAGSDHRKFLRQVFVSVDITAPLYWWKEFDTYKVGTVACSTSTMHKLHARPLTREDFSHDRLSAAATVQLDSLIAFLEAERQAYVQTKDPLHWHNLIQLLPSSYRQLRTVSCNYEVLINMYAARKNHKLPEWQTLCGMFKDLPYAAELILLGEEVP
ncbi:MAG: hypothetical protein WDA00_05230 [Eubacteriales bacterium]